jgi:hypothetical protein
LCPLSKYCEVEQGKEGERKQSIYMMLHLHPSSYDDEACISMLEGVVGYGDGDLAVVGTVREVILYMLLMLLLFV